MRFSGRGQGDVLNVLAVDRIEELDARILLGRLLEAVEALVLDEGVEGADDADLGRPVHLGLHVVGEVLADLFAGALVVDADERRIVAIGDAGVDCNDRNAGLLRRGDGGLYPIHVDREEHDAVDLLGDVVLDRRVLGGRLVVGVEDHQLDAVLVGGGLGPVIDLVEEQGLLVDGDECDRLRLRSRHSKRAGGQRHESQALYRCLHERFSIDSLHARSRVAINFAGAEHTGTTVSLPYSRHAVQGFPEGSALPAAVINHSAATIWAIARPIPKRLRPKWLMEEGPLEEQSAFAAVAPFSKATLEPGRELCRTAPQSSALSSASPRPHRTP